MEEVKKLNEKFAKETFRIFDAVKIYEALQGLTAMQPVVANPAITFTQLARELVQVTSDAEHALVRDQFIAAQFGAGAGARLDCRCRSACRGRQFGVRDRQRCHAVLGLECFGRSRKQFDDQQLGAGSGRRLDQRPFLST